MIWSSWEFFYKEKAGCAFLAQFISSVFEFFKFLNNKRKDEDKLLFKIIFSSGCDLC